MTAVPGVGRTDQVPTVPSLLADPLPETVPEVVRRLADLRALTECGPAGPRDGVACFTYLYEIITREVLAWLEADRFGDAEFLARLDVEFARRFFTAVRANAAGAAASRSWQVLFDRRGDPVIDPMRFAVAGVNAHVNLDLALALLTTCRALPRPLDAARRADYDAINQIFADHMRSLRQHFESRFGQLLDRVVFDDLADDAGDLTVVLARDAAWRRAVELDALSPEEFERECAAIDWRASMIGRAVLGFGAL